MFGSPDMTLENPSLIVEERERNPDMGSSDEYTFQKEGEIAVVEKYFRGTTGKRVLSFGLDPGTWTALANKYGVERARKYVQYRLGPQWSAIPDSERPTLDQYFAEALGRYPEITMSLPNNYPVSTVRRLSELVLKVSDVMEPADRRYLAEWLRRQTIAPYALREKEAKLTPMQYFSIIVNKERAMALLRTTLQELRSGHDVCIAGGELHGVTTTEAIDRAQGELGWHVIQEDLALVA